MLFRKYDYSGIIQYKYTESHVSLLISSSIIWVQKWDNLYDFSRIDSRILGLVQARQIC